MSPVTVVVPYTPGPLFEEALRPLVSSPLAGPVVYAGRERLDVDVAASRPLPTGSLLSQQTLGAILDEVGTPYFLLLPDCPPLSCGPELLGRLVGTAESSGAALVYSDFYEVGRRGKVLHPLADYQPGSVRDDFDFGAMMLFSAAAVREARERHGLVPDLRFAGLYDLRLKVSIDHPLHHLPEPLYTVAAATDGSSGKETLFAYVDPANTAVQREMERAFTEYLKKIGAYVPAASLRRLEARCALFPVEASVVIPVRNRKETISQAVGSALSQETDFPFNVIVVDNHSEDGTTELLSGLAVRHTALLHLIPGRCDLAIGGCWNEALQSAACGRYAVQLDSDDLYSGPRTLQRLVDMLRRGGYGMVIGSYTLVDFNLEEIPPGLIDHREWTDENGHNNALRINGLGAPRAFDTALIRKIGFPNVSYGEDYGVALRVCGEHRIGRIYENLYLCRRWPGNTDAALDIDGRNRNDAFKDGLRTAEILARQKRNRGE
jgi:hypothetical protein